MLFIGFLTRAFSATTQDNLGQPSQGYRHHHGHDPPTSVVNQKDASTGLHTGHSDVGIFLVEVLSSQMT